MKYFRLDEITNSYMGFCIYRSKKIKRLINLIEHDFSVMKTPVNWSRKIKLRKLLDLI